RAPAQRPAHVEAPGAEPEAVGGHALQLSGDHPQVLRALGHVDLADHLRGPHVRQLARHGRDVVGLGRDRRVLRVRERLGELLVAAVQVADDGIHRDHRLALEGEDGAEDPVGRRVLRPHVHGDALGTAVPHLEDLPRFDVHLRRYCIGECAAGLRMMDFMSARHGADLPRNVCHSGSWSTLLRTAARSLRSLYAQRWTASLSWPASVWKTPTFFEYFSRVGMMPLKSATHSPRRPTCARYQRNS